LRTKPESLPIRSALVPPLPIAHSFAEFFCAAFIILGLFTRLAAVPLVIAMSVALIYAHKGQFFGDGEKAAIYLVAFLAILFIGPGKASLDRFIGK
jgi:putative oxidoreductase